MLGTCSSYLWKVVFNSHRQTGLCPVYEREIESDQLIWCRINLREVGIQESVTLASSVQRTWLWFVPVLAVAVSQAAVGSLCLGLSLHSACVPWQVPGSCSFQGEQCARLHAGIGAGSRSRCNPCLQGSLCRAWQSSSAWWCWKEEGFVFTYLVCM